MAATIAMCHLQLSSKMLARLIDHLQSIPSLTSNLASLIKRVNHYCKETFVLHLSSLLSFLLVALFPPSPTLLVDFWIYNTFLRLLSSSAHSIRTGQIDSQTRSFDRFALDFHVSLTKSRNETTSNQHTVIDLNEIGMFCQIASAREQSVSIRSRND